MKNHYCVAEKQHLIYENQCSWCGEKEMNAYELANELNQYKGIATKQASDMLRQQADRIAELEKELNEHFKDGFESGKIEGWKAHKFHTQTNAEPVAWLINGYLSDEYFRTSELDEIEPLYTTPQTKPLSDEEINAIDNSVKHSELALSHNEYMNKFARAIEERHGIKYC